MIRTMKEDRRVQREIGCHARNSEKLLNTHLNFPSVIPDSFYISRTERDKARVRIFGQREYGKHYPANKVNFRENTYDDTSCVIHAENSLGEIISTVRILFDSPLGLPISSIVEEHIDKRRAEGKNLAEIGEFVITDEASGQLKDYYRLFYEIAIINDIDYMIVIVKRKDIPFHVRVLGTTVLARDIGNNYGSKHDFACLEVPINNLKDEFFTWADINKNHLVQHDEIYSVSEWNEYARLHASVTASGQVALFQDACSYLMGDIIDCGCGSAKLAPLLRDDPKVGSYTGIDFSPSMVTVARDIIQKLNKPSFTIKHCAIEEAEGSYTGAVSIHSYYAWPDPLKVLKHIHSLLVDGGLFVLATPNEQLDQKKLLHEAEKELIGHPDFEAFKQYNLQLEANSKAHFVTMDHLIQQVQEAGFEVIKCHQKHYMGEVNFIVMKK